jgi:hypothetical protein
MNETSADSTFQWAFGTTRSLGRYSPGELHGLAVREILRELDLAQGDHVRAVKAGLGRLRKQEILSKSEVREISKLADIMHGQKSGVNSLSRFHDKLMLNSAPSPVAISIAHICVEAANQFSIPEERIDLTSAAIGGAVAGALIGELIQGSSGAVFGSIMGAAFASKRVAQKRRPRVASTAKAVIPVAQSFVVFEPLGLPTDWSPGTAYTTVLNSLLNVAGNQRLRRQRLAVLRDNELITAAEYGQLSSLVDAIRKRTKVTKVLPIIFAIHDNLMLAKDASPVALTISSIVANSASINPLTVEAESVLGADVDGAIDGARAGFEYGGYVGSPISGAVAGGFIGGAISSAGAAKD